MITIERTIYGYSIVDGHGEDAAELFQSTTGEWVLHVYCEAHIPVSDLQRIVQFVASAPSTIVIEAGATT